MTKDEMWEILDETVLFEPNDSKTWEKIERLIPGARCDSSLNPPEVLMQNVVRFEVDGEILCYPFEYDEE